jgi:hypothetical protein
MRFVPKSETELQREQEKFQESRLCPKGKQPFTVMECSEQKSKSGKDMLKLKLNVQAENGRDYHIYDYISPEFLAHKFRHFFSSIGRIADYELGNLECANYVGAVGFCEVRIQKARDEYEAKAVIDDYIKRDRTPDTSASPAAPEPVPADDSDCPF